MDRFIDYTYYCINELENGFKIQYGQIYSSDGDNIKTVSDVFKIQYGQIYS